MHSIIKNIPKIYLKYRAKNDEMMTFAEWKRGEYEKKCFKIQPRKEKLGLFHSCRALETLKLLLFRTAFIPLPCEYFNK